MGGGGDGGGGGGESVGRRLAPGRRSNDHSGVPIDQKAGAGRACHRRVVELESTFVSAVATRLAEGRRALPAAKGRF